MACFKWQAISIAPPAPGAPGNQDVIFMADPKAVRQAQELCSQLSLEVKPTIAGTETLVINFDAVDEGDETFFGDSPGLPSSPPASGAQPAAHSTTTPPPTPTAATHTAVATSSSLAGPVRAPGAGGTILEEPGEGEGEGGDSVGQQVRAGAEKSFAFSTPTAGPDASKKGTNAAAGGLPPIHTRGASAAAGPASQPATAPSSGAGVRSSAAHPTDAPEPASLLFPGFPGLAPQAAGVAAGSRPYTPSVAVPAIGNGHALPGATSGLSMFSQPPQLARTNTRSRGFVRVQSIREGQVPDLTASGRDAAGVFSAEPQLNWTASRRALEVLVVNEQASGPGMPGLSHDSRLAARLDRLNLDVVAMAGDGNCQFRSLSHELYGTADHHLVVRQAAITHIIANRAEFECFLGEDFDSYVRGMARACTWGDELTLRAVCDTYGVIVHVVTSDPANWWLSYKPRELKNPRELFLTYIAPIHYNAIRRRSSLRALSSTLTSSFKRMGSMGRSSSSGAAPGSEGDSARTSSGPPSATPTRLSSAAIPPIAEHT